MPYTPKEFIISDLHFGHKNIIKYDKRPFTSIEEHDETLISNWNSVVTNRDKIFIAGDLFLCSNTKAVEILDRLNGEKHLITGNHDQENLLKSATAREKFASIQQYLEHKVDIDGLEYRIQMMHYPIECWKRGYVHLHGHTHHSRVAETISEKRNRADVGANGFYINYTPQLLTRCVKIAANFPFDTKDIPTHELENDDLFLYDDVWFYRPVSKDDIYIRNTKDTKYLEND